MFDDLPVFHGDFPGRVTWVFLRFWYLLFRQLMHPSESNGSKLLPRSGMVSGGETMVPGVKSLCWKLKMVGRC